MLDLQSQSWMPGRPRNTGVHLFSTVSSSVVGMAACGIGCSEESQQSSEFPLHSCISSSNITNHLRQLWSVCHLCVLTFVDVFILQQVCVSALLLLAARTRAMAVCFGAREVGVAHSRQPVYVGMARYQTMQKIGEGMYGVVYKALDRMTNEVRLAAQRARAKGMR